jgi:hypothetical protein
MLAVSLRWPISAIASLASLMLLTLAAMSCGGEEQRVPAPAATPTPALTTAPTPTATATPVVAAAGAVAEWAGVRLTLTEMSDPWSPSSAEHYPAPTPGKRYVRFDFVLENAGATGTVAAFALDFKLVDAQGFVCDGGIGADSGVDLAQGEKTRAWLVFQCDQGAALGLLTIDGVRFRFQ